MSSEHRVCEYCGECWHMDHMIYVDGKHYCDDCFTEAEMAFCVDCEEPFDKKIDGKHYCKTKKGYICDNCNHDHRLECISCANDEIGKLSDEIDVLNEKLRIKEDSRNKIKEELKNEIIDSIKEI